MSDWFFKGLLALTVCFCAAAAGYVLGNENASGGTAVAAPPPGAIRVLYSLDKKQNDKQIIALINGTRDHAYFAMYEFTLADIADALVAAKRRGVDVEGLVDAGESRKSYAAPIMAELRHAGIPVEIERHPDGKGIMHIKALVTDSAYAIGSYNWTASATTENDEVLEIGTAPALVNNYRDLLARLLKKYKVGNTETPTAASRLAYTDAPQHIGEYASVRGTLYDVHRSASGNVFLDFCHNYRHCPFSGVIFADDAAKFGDLSHYVGQSIALTGTISSYHGRAEIKLSDPAQIGR